MSRCAGAGREHSQAASPGWPMEIFRSMDIILGLWIRVGLGGRKQWALLLSWISNPLFSGSLNLFSKSWVFFRSFAKFAKFVTWGSTIAAHGVTANCSSGGEKNSFVYSLFCIFVIIIVISSSSIISISISFVALLNCFYLNPWVSLFFPFLLPIPLRVGDGWANVCRLLVASCWVKPRR